MLLTIPLISGNNRSAQNNIIKVSKRSDGHFTAQRNKRKKIEPHKLRGSIVSIGSRFL